MQHQSDETDLLLSLFAPFLFFIYFSSFKNHVLDVFALNYVKVTTHLYFRSGFFLICFVKNKFICVLMNFVN